MRLVALVAFVTACSSKPTSAPPPVATPVASGCEAIAARFRATLKAASGTCKTADDCACYNPVIDEAWCGGVTDRTTADTLTKIEAEFHAASCNWPHQCAAQACAPRCDAGRCQ